MFGRLSRYKELGGKVTIIVEEGKGHYPTAPKDPKPVVNFILSRQTAKTAEPKLRPAAALPQGHQSPGSSC
jgi:hypothetical protein